MTVSEFAETLEPLIYLDYRDMVLPEKPEPEPEPEPLPVVKKKPRFISVVRPKPILYVKSTKELSPKKKKELKWKQIINAYGGPQIVHKQKGSKIDWANIRYNNMILEHNILFVKPMVSSRR